MILVVKDTIKIGSQSENKTISYIAYAGLSLIITLILLLFLENIQDNNKINGIMNDKYILEKAIINFHNDYGCVPGACSNKILQQHFFYFPNLVKECINSDEENYSNQINTVQKSKCALWQLQAAGLIHDKVNISYNDTGAILTNVTLAKGRAKGTAWAIASVPLNNDVMTERFLPAELSEPASYAGSLYRGRVMLILLTDKFYKVRARKNYLYNDYYEIEKPEKIAGISAKLAQKIDYLYDDNLPYSGKIISGRDHGLYYKDFSSGKKGCTKLKGKFYEAKYLNKNASYNTASSFSKDNGCVMAFILPELK